MNLHPLIRHAPAPGHPGWHTWDLDGPVRFNSAIGRLLVRRGDEGLGLCRMFPDETHANLGGVVHGGALMTFIDMALFAGGYMVGVDVVRALTLDCSVQFLSAGRIGPPLDAEVEPLSETGRLVFFRGRVLQEERLVAAFSATLRKAERQ
jgi:uncharacterized protein (TIGR00369 family)